MALRLALAPMLVLLALVSATPLAGANEPGNVSPYGFAHGHLELTASKGGAILSGRDLVPGDRVAGKLTIANTGTLAGSFTLSGAVRGSGRLAEHLVLTVSERNRGVDSLLYSGSLAGLRAVELGLIGPAQARTFRFTVSLPATGAPGLQGLRTTASFTWTAVQAS
jgi:spore coat-associated protein N